MPLDGTDFEQQDAVLDVLRRARRLVADPARWRAPAACLVQAVERSSAFPDRALLVLRDALPGDWLARDPDNLYQRTLLIDYYDAPGRKKADIDALFGRAIDRLSTRAV